MFLMLYLALMAASLVLPLILFILPSRRRTGLQLALATIISLPGIFAFQFIAGIVIGTLLAVVLTFYSATNAPDWVRWLVGIPSVLFTLCVFAGASACGCYCGARFGWTIGGGTPLRQAILELKGFIISGLNELLSNTRFSRRAP